MCRSGKQRRHPINHHYHRGGGDINNIFIAAATIRGEPRPAPCPHFLTFPAPLHTSSAVAQNSVLDVTLVSHVLTHACARWQVTSAVPLCSPVPLQSRFNRGWFARQRVPLCSPALHRCRVSLCCPFLRIPFCSPAFCSYAFCSYAAALQLARLCSPVPLCS